jgi:hypothetical protein
MTPDQYRDAIARLGLSQVEAGRFLGVDARSSRRWALGEAKIPDAVSLLLSLMVRKKLQPSDVRR